jgi:hypothetical protein
MGHRHECCSRATDFVKEGRLTFLHFEEAADEGILHRIVNVLDEPHVGKDLRKIRVRLRAERGSGSEEVSRAVRQRALEKDEPRADLSVAMNID